jgi:hypothetical protein
MQHIEELKKTSLKRIQRNAQDLARDAYTVAVKGAESVKNGRDIKAELRDLINRTREAEPDIDSNLARRLTTEYYYAARIALWAATGAHDAVAERAAEHVGLGTMQREYKEALDGKTDD